MKMKRKFPMWRWKLRKNDIEIVVTARASLLEAHALILKKSEGIAVLAGDTLNHQSPGKLERENAFRSGLRSQTHGGGGLQRIIWRNGSLNGVVQRVKGYRMNRRIREAMGGPNIIIRFAAGLAELREEEWLVTFYVENDIERACGHAFDIGVKTGLGICRQPVGKNPESVAGIELSYGGFPLSRDGSIHLSRQSGRTELTQKFVAGGVREAGAGADKILVAYG